MVKFIVYDLKNDFSFQIVCDTYDDCLEVLSHFPLHSIHIQEVCHIEL